MTNWIKPTFLAGILGLGLAMTSTQVSAEPSGTFRFAEQAKLITLDPHKHTGGGVSYLRPVYETLFDRTPEGTVEPFLAAGYETDGLDVMVTLKEGITFSDGEPLTAEVAAANLNRATEQGVLAALKLVDSTEATGDYTLTIHLKSPDPAIIDGLAGTAGMMVSPKALEDPALDRNPVGTGPYLYDAAASREGEVRVYVPNPNYRHPDDQGLEQLNILEIPDNTARLNALKTDQVDLAIFLSSPQAAILDRAPGLKLIKQAGGTTYHLVILDRDGAEVPAFADPRVRHAMAYAINRPAFSKAVEFGLSTPAYQPFGKGVWGYNPDLEGRFAYDPDKARALLAEAGYPDGFTFTIPSIPIFASRLEAVAGFLKDIGITMNIQTVEPGTLARRSRTTDFAATNLVWNNHADPKFLTTYYIGENAVFNPFKIKPDADILALSDKGVTMVDPVDRTPVYHELFDKFVDEGTLIFVTTTPLLFGATDAVADNATVKYRPGTDTPYFRGIRVDN